MAVIRWGGFEGENRALHPKLLPDAVGTVSLNQKPGRGDLRPWSQPKTVASVPGGRKTIYRMGRDVQSDGQYWLSWTGRVHAMRGFEAENPSERTYYTGDGFPKVTDSVIGLGVVPSTPDNVQPTLVRPDPVVNPSTPQVYPVGWRKMGLPEPKTPVTVTKNSPPDYAKYVDNYADLTAAWKETTQKKEEWGKSHWESTGKAEGTRTMPQDTTKSWDGEVQTYFYVYTYINDWGWESAASPPSPQVDRETDAWCTITGFQSPPEGAYNITGIRLYRTQSATSSATEFFFVSEVKLDTLTTVDDNPNLGEVLSTRNWLPAPDNLTFLTPLWNGMAAGIVDNTVRFSEPYATYAWPVEYDAIPPDGRPVALGVFGQTLLVLTTGRPLILAGSTPDSMDQAPMDFNQACVAPSSVVGMGAGVAWASNDGLCFYGSMGPRIITAGLLTRDDWQKLKPASIVGKHYEGLYFGSYDDGSGQRKGFMINPVNPTGIYFLDRGHEVMHFDELQDQLYVLDGASVRRWDSGDSPMSYRARSKVFRQPAPVNFSCAEVVADAYPVTMRLFAGGALRFETQVVSRESFALPGGYAALDWQVEIEGTSPVQGFAMATSKAELSQT